MDSDRLAVITGGTKGIGLAVAHEILGRYDVLLLAYRVDHDTARAAAHGLAGAGTRVVVQQCDVAHPDDVERLFTRADELGRLGALVNSAGFAEGQMPFDQIDAERWMRVLATNVVGTAICCRQAIRRMKGHGASNRAIVNISSRAAELGAPGEYVDYAASKAAVDALTRGLALEVAPLGIRVNSVRPGIIDTGFHASAGDPQRAQRLATAQPMGRAGTAQEVARAVAWLMSEQASYTTGSIIDVSGGR